MSMREWIVLIYASEWHTNATWAFEVIADSKCMAISSAMWWFKSSAEYTDDFDRVQANPQ
jgi:hypothetical protein